MQNISTKNIKDFTLDDTIYIRELDAFNKPARYCQFVKYESGRVTGTVLSVEQRHESGSIGREISAALKHCALVGPTAQNPQNTTTYHWFRPDGYAYTEREATLEAEEGVTRHPSYGIMMVMQHHGVGDRMSLFGSSIRHDSRMVFTIHEAEMHRGLNSDRPHATGQILQIAMSPTQFADMITSGGKGGGTPVTIRWRVGIGYIEECPFESKRQVFQNEFKSQMKNITSLMDDTVQGIKNVLEKKTLNATDREYITNQVETLQMHLGSNVPFVAQQFDRQLDKSTTEAKGEIEAFFESKIRSLGLEAFQTEMKKLLGVSIEPETKLLEPTLNDSNGGEGE